MKPLPKGEEKKGDLSPEELKERLIQLAQSSFWEAIKQYNRGRDVFISQSLRSLDPATQSTEMARIQGMSMGLYDLTNGIDEELKRIEEKMKDAEVDKTKKSS